MDIKGYTVRHANMDDISAIMKVERESFPEGIVESEDVFRERIRVFEDGFLILLDNSGKCIGYITSEIWNYKEGISEDMFKLGHSIATAHIPEGDELYVSSMGLLKEARGSRLGLFLLSQLLDRLSSKYCNIKSSILIVSNAWEKAINIYKELGYKEVHIIHSFFKTTNTETNDGLVMRKMLYTK